MKNSRMYVRPTAQQVPQPDGSVKEVRNPFPYQPVRGASSNRMVTAEGAWVNINSYYNRGIRSGALEFGDPPEAKTVAAPKPPKAEETVAAPKPRAKRTKKTTKRGKK